MLILARLPRARLWRVLVLALLLLPLAGKPAPAAGADLSPRYFPETGHVVSGRFREVWESGGGLFIYGLPLTSQFPFPSTDGKVYQVQYFERAVFEYHPENAAPYDVLLTQVGREAVAGRQGEAAFQPNPPSTESDLTYVPQTGHNVGPIFLAYWQKFGGLATLRLPDLGDDQRDESGRRARLSRDVLRARALRVSPGERGHRLRRAARPTRSRADGSRGGCPRAPASPKRR